MIRNQRVGSTKGILLFILIGLECFLTASAAPPSVCDVAGQLNSLIYSYNQLDNKLERHEHRERALGELLKKAMQTLQKGQKNLEPIKGFFTRLDERVSQIETQLLMQENKYNIQRGKIDEVFENIYKWMRENDECLKRPPIAANEMAPIIQQIPNPPANLELTEEFMMRQEQTNKELMSQLQALTVGVQNLIEISKQTSESPNEVTEILTKIEDKLVTYSVVTPAPIIAPITNKEFEDKVLDKFEEINSELTSLKAMPKPHEGLKDSDKDFIAQLSKETLNALQETKTEVLGASEKAFNTTSIQIREAETGSANRMDKIGEVVFLSANVLKDFYAEMNNSYSKLNDAVEIFNKFNNILMTNSEHVLETQRKVEFGSFQITEKLGKLIESQREELENQLKERLTNIDDNMIINKKEAMKNFTEIIDSEIGPVWRRIEIMGDEIRTSTDLLKMLNGRNDAYVNSTLSAMDSMGTTFGKIDNRMLELTDNLNFLLGKLSLMSQEFGNIKISLSESLDDLRLAFKNVEENVPKGPGPHNIAKTKYETHINPLDERNKK